MKKYYVLTVLLEESYQVTFMAWDKVIEIKSYKKIEDADKDINSWLEKPNK